MADIETNIAKVLVTEEEIQAKVKELGATVTRDYRDKSLLLVGILKGCFVFMADLVRHIELNCPLDFMRVSSYGDGDSTTGQVNIELDMKNSVAGRDVLIVEDIVDSGNTLSFLKKLFFARGAKSIKICTLLDKPERRVIDIKADYVGVTIPNEFVVGYGLDFAEDYRNLPYVGVLKPSAYTNK